jgi:hypothetical protein
MLAINALNFSLITSFASKALLELYKIELLSQESQTLLNEDSNIETLMDELILDSKPFKKRSSSCLK